MKIGAQFRGNKRHSQPCCLANATRHTAMLCWEMQFTQQAILAASEARLLHRKGWATAQSKNKQGATVLKSLTTWFKKGTAA